MVLILELMVDHRLIGLASMGIKMCRNIQAKRILVTVTVPGSIGRLRFLVKKGEIASAVLRMALKIYAREERLPVLGTNPDEFRLYLANDSAKALEPGDVINLDGARNFVLCKKPTEAVEEKVELHSVAACKKGNLLSWISGGLSKVAMGIKQGRNNKVKPCGRMLVTVTVQGSTGPVRFVVNEGEVASTVLKMALKTYARVGRLPALGTNHNNFLLYPANDGLDALEPGYMINMNGTRNFLLCKKKLEVVEKKVVSQSVAAGKKGIFQDGYGLV